MLYGDEPRLPVAAAAGVLVDIRVFVVWRAGAGSDLAVPAPALGMVAGKAVVAVGSNQIKYKGRKMVFRDRAGLVVKWLWPSS